jgi:hypothetical protein
MKPKDCHWFVSKPIHLAKNTNPRVIRNLRHNFRTEHGDNGQLKYYFYDIEVYPKQRINDIIKNLLQNTCKEAIDLAIEWGAFTHSYRGHTHTWDLLSANPGAISILRDNLDKINWKSFSRNPAHEAIAMMNANIDKLNLNELINNKNTSDIPRIIEQHFLSQVMSMDHINDNLVKFPPVKDKWIRNFIEAIQNEDDKAAYFARQLFEMKSEDAKQIIDTYIEFVDDDDDTTSRHDLKLHLKVDTTYAELILKNPAFISWYPEVVFRFLQKEMYRPFLPSTGFHRSDGVDYLEMFSSTDCGNDDDDDDDVEIILKKLHANEAYLLMHLARTHTQEAMYKLKQQRLHYRHMVIPFSRVYDMLNEKLAVHPFIHLIFDHGSLK